VFNNNAFLLLVQPPPCCLQMTVARAQREIFFRFRVTSFYMVTTDKSRESVCNHIYYALYRGDKRHENVLSTLDAVCNNIL